MEKNEPKIIIRKFIDKETGKERIIKYERGSLLGKGSFSNNYKLTNLENNHISAVKIIPKNEEKKFLEEINILKSLNFPNIISYEGLFEDNENLYLLTEFCPNGNFQDLLKSRKNLTEFEIQVIIVRLVKILQYLKSKKILHGDLKMSHLLLSEKMEIKLCGFHLAKQLKSENDKKKGRNGTVDYMAPEVLEKTTYYSFEIELWSLGVIIYKLVTGKFPFRADSKNISEILIKKGEYSFPEGKHINKYAKDLIKQLIVIDPSQRLNLDKILKHNFFKNLTKIPKTFPKSILNNPPPLEFIKSYIVNFEEKNLSDEKDETIENLKIELSREQYLTQQLCQKMKILENELNIEKKKTEKESLKVKELNEKNKELQLLLNNNNSNRDNTITLMNKIISKDEEIRELKERFPFNLEKGEKLISIIFISFNQEIHYSIICKNTDIFSTVENFLYNEYPKYRETENYFIFNGTKINRNKTLKENKIENSSIIMLKQLEDNDED